MTPTRLPTVGGDQNQWGTVLNAFLSARTSNEVIFLDNYISASASAAANKSGWFAAVAATNQGTKPLIGHIGRYPMDNGLIMPNFPLCWYGWGKSVSVLKFPQQSSSGQAAISYDHSDAGLIQSGSPWYNSGSTNDLNLTHQWLCTDLGFEGSDWGGGTGYGGYFPKLDNNTSVNRRHVIKPDFHRCAFTFFNGVGLSVDMSGLNDDVTVNDCMFAFNAGDGVQLGSDSRAFNVESFGNGGWGLNQVDHRVIQVLGCKAYNNGSIGPWTAGGVRLVGNWQLINNFYLQDNFGPGLLVDGATAVMGNTIVADRNCAGFAFHSVTTNRAGIVLNNVNACILDACSTVESGPDYDSRAASQIYGVNITGTQNSASRITISQAEYNPAAPVLVGLVQGNSGGVTVVNP